MQYLDQSPLERMHVAEAYMLCANNTHVDIFQNMSPKDYNDVRAVVVKLVLATDLAAHFGFVEKLKLTTSVGTGKRGVRSSSAGSSKTKEKAKKQQQYQNHVDLQLSLRASNVDNMTVMKIAIKLSDIGHCAKELDLHLKWSELVNEEFYLQGTN